jgi:hypothetical protein
VQTPEDLLNITAMEESRDYFKLKSFFVTPETTLDAAAYQMMMDWVSQPTNAVSYIECDLLGPKSAAASRSANATAFPYRNAIMSVQYGMEWFDAASSEANIDFVDSLQTNLTKFNVTKDSPAYVNYIDIDMDTSVAYYGGHYGPLQAIKSTYDPNNFFRNMQSISPLSGVPPSNGSSPGPLVKMPPVVGPAQAPKSSGVATSMSFWTLLVAMVIASFASKGNWA